MSKNVQKIERALSELGLISTSIVWEPWGMAMEMCGIEGGWIVWATDPLEDDKYDFQKLSTEDLLEQIYRHPYYQAVHFWGDCEYPETKHSFFNDYGFGVHIPVCRK